MLFRSHLWVGVTLGFSHGEDECHSELKRGYGTILHQEELGTRDRESVEEDERDFHVDIFSQKIATTFEESIQGKGVYKKSFSVSIDHQTINQPQKQTDSNNKMARNDEKESSSIWGNKIVLHRGWHRLSNADETKPLQNTRNAYLQAAYLGVAYAECDVWATRDGQIVLNHDSTFASVVSAECAAQNAATVATSIDSLDWATIQEFELLDGSKPVLLSTVLADLKGTSTRLALEVKCSRLALPLAKYLIQHPDLVSSIGFMMGFAADCVIIFRGAARNHTVLREIRVLWLVDNPREPYSEDVLDEGETTFDFLKLSVTDFFTQQNSVASLLFSVGFHGLYIQYRSGLTPTHVSNIRQELTTLMGPNDVSDIFVGIWADGELDPDFDTPENLSKWAEVADALNSDCPFMKTMEDIPSSLLAKCQ